MANLSSSQHRRALIFVAALWWGSLTLLGALVVPMLFAHLATPVMAGTMAAKLFSAQTWVSAVCGLLLLVLSRPTTDVPAPAPLNTAWILTGLLLALLLEFAVAPRILARENMVLWHGLGVLFFALQWLCAQVALWQVSDRD
jgi:uncharacterized membrane protein